MINLSRYFGAFICAVQMAVVTGVAVLLKNFIPSWFGTFLLAIFIGAMFIGATQFFDRIFGFTPSERVWWVSFVLLPASSVIWMAHTTFKMVSKRFYDVWSLAGGQDAAANSLLPSVSQFATLPTPIVFQLGLLVGAYLLLWPSLKEKTIKPVWLLLPIVAVVIGILFGAALSLDRWFMGS